MGVKDVGIGKIISSMTTLLTTGIVSSTSTDPSPSDTTIAAEISATEDDLYDITASNKTLTAKHSVDSLTGNGLTFTTPIIKTSDGTLFSSAKHPDLAKTSSDEVIYFHKIVIDQKV